MPTSEEYTLLRGDGHRIKLYLSVSQPRVLLTGQVNAASPTRGATSIPYDTGTGSGFSAIKAGHVLKVVTATGTEHVRIRAVTGSQASGTFTVAANAIVWADNQEIEALEDHPLDHRVPRFISDGTFYKDWDVAYTDQNSNVKPVTVAGPHRAGFLESGSSSFRFDLNDSYPMAEGATVDSFNLTVTPSAGVTITNPSPGVYDVEVTQPGQYWAEASSTDSNSKSQLTYRRLFVYNPILFSDEDDYPYTDFSLDTLHGDFGRGGWSLGLTVRNADPENFPEDALVVLWYEIWYGDEKVYIGGAASAQNILFAGYIKSGSIEANWEDSAVKFEAATIEDRLKEVLMYSISLAAVRNPAKWYEYLLELTSGRAIHHILSEHSTLLEIADVLDLDISDLLRKYAGIQQTSLYAMAEQMAQAIAGHLVCDNYGRLRFVQDIQLLNDADRAAAPVRVELVPGSDCQAISITEQPGRVALVTVSGLSFDGQTVEAFCAKSPGDVPSFPGAGTLPIDRQVLADQDHANELAGRHDAKANNPYPEVRLSMNGVWIGLMDIAKQEWWTLSLDGSETARGIVWTDKNLVLRTVSVDVDPVNGGLSIQATFEPEALGPVGVEMECISELPEGAEAGVPRWDTGGGGDDLVIESMMALYGFVDDGSGVYYRDDNDTTWEQMDDGEVHYGEIDPWWQSRNNTWNPLGAVLWQALTGAMYRSPDGGVTWIDVTPATAPSNPWSDSPAPAVDALQFVCVRGNMFVQDWFYVLARWQNSGGTWRGWLLWTTDNGASWSWKALDDADEVYPLYLTVSLGSAADIWMTYLRDGNLYLSKGHPLVPDVWTETDLGAATVTEVLSREKWAFPVAAYGDDLLVFVGGRMEDPAGLTGIQHIIMSDDEASTFSTVEDGWGTDHGAALLVGADPGSGRLYYAVRQGAAGGAFLTFERGASSVQVEDNDSFGGVSVKLDDERAAILFQDGIDGEIAGKVVSISTGAIVLGSSQQLANLDTYVAAARLSDDEFIIGYRDLDNSDRPTLSTVSASGNTLNAATPVEADTIAADAGRMIVVTSGANSGIVAYGHVVGINTEAWLTKFITLGDAIFPSTPHEHSESASGVFFIAGVGLDINNIMILYRGSGDDLKAQILEFSVSIVEGTAVQVENGSGSITFDTSTEQSLVKLEDGKVVVVYAEDNSGTVTIKARVIEYTGATIDTVGAATTISTGGSTGSASIEKISSDRILIVYKNASGFNRAETFSISGTTITSDSNAGSAGGSAPNPPYVTRVNDNYMIVSWQESDSDIAADFLHNTSAAAVKFYQGTASLAEKSDIPVAGVDPGGLAVNLAGHAAVGSNAPSDQMVVRAVSPYTSWTDLTGSVPTDSAVRTLHHVPLGVKR